MQPYSRIGRTRARGNGGFEEEHYERTCVDSQWSYVLSCICDQSETKRKVRADPNTKEFDTANSFDGLVVHQELHVRIRVFLGRNGHGFGLAGICCEMINTKAVMDSINVFLEVREVRFTGDWLV